MSDQTVVIGTAHREDGTDVRYIYDSDRCCLYGVCDECRNTEATA